MQLVYLNSKSKKKQQNTKQKQSDRNLTDQINKKYASKSVVTSTYKAPEIPAGRGTSHIASKSDGIGNATAPEIKKYTGDKMLGISQLHKSNGIPARRYN